MIAKSMYGAIGHTRLAAWRRRGFAGGSWHPWLRDQRGHNLVRLTSGEHTAARTSRVSSSCPACTPWPHGRIRPVHQLQAVQTRSSAPRVDRR